MKTEWRPDGWANPSSSFDGVNMEISAIVHNVYEAGASAMLSALIKWLDEPCDRHGTRHHDGRYATSRHKDCPQCWSELRGEK